MRYTEIDLNGSFPLNIDLAAVDAGERYVMLGTRDMTSGAISITATGGRAAVEGDVIDFLHVGTLNNHSSPNVLTILGSVVPDYIADQGCRAICRYNGATWDVTYMIDAYGEFIRNTMIPNDEIDGDKIANLSIEKTKMAGSSASSVLFWANNSDNGEINLTGKGKIIIGGTAAPGTAQATEEGQVFITEADLDPAPANLEESMILTICFKNAATTINYRLKAPCKGTVIGFSFSNYSQIGPTDNAIITPKNNGGSTMTGGVLTMVADLAKDNETSSTPTANNTFAKDDILTFSAQKTTAGGEGILTIRYKRQGA